MGKIIWDIINLIKLDKINLKTGLQWVANIDHESWISWKLNYKDELKNAEWASSFSLASESAFWQPVLQEQVWPTSHKAKWRELCLNLQKLMVMKPFYFSPSIQAVHLSAHILPTHLTNSFTWHFQLLIITGKRLFVKISFYKLHSQDNF